VGPIAKALRDKLTHTFQPVRLELVDDSDRHAGHAGHRSEGESHFTLVIESAHFSGMSRVARQRAVHAALKDELAGPVHALSVSALAPGEVR
jgi:BolA family transcriptional regulator, general stress-responsive regulator